MSSTPQQRAPSPHIIDQAMAPQPLQRKPVEDHNPSPTSLLSPTSTHTPNNNTTTYKQQDPSTMLLNGSKYAFDDSSPTPSVRNSYVDPAMDPQVRLEEYEWAELEEQFAKRMEAFKADEDAIWEEWKGWGELFGAWASTISEHDEERASKRLRTRVAFTQGREEDLEQKRQHYIKVVQAFEAALALMG